MNPKQITYFLVASFLSAELVGLAFESLSKVLVILIAGIALLTIPYLLNKSSVLTSSKMLWAWTLSFLGFFLFMQTLYLKSLWAEMALSISFSIIIAICFVYCGKEKVTHNS